MDANIRAAAAEGALAAQGQRDGTVCSTGGSKACGSRAGGQDDSSCCCCIYDSGSCMNFCNHSGNEISLT
ncbi:MAG: hypothetical protein FWD06_02370 [Oscillospiraceae bacterium]|nr:hypothetical protein [Oscillospiraceae bacterium]